MTVRLDYLYSWLNHYNSCADVTVAMTHGQRSVTEGSTVMVCLTLTGQLGISIVVDLTSTMGTGKIIMVTLIIEISIMICTASAEDFTLVPGELTFTASDSSTYQECSFVSITSDDIFEDDETFTLTLNPNTLPSRVTISGVSSTIVTIPANGGQWNYLSMYPICIH